MELQWQENTTSVKPPHWQSGYPGYREGEETVVMRGDCGLWWTWEEPMCLGQTCHRSSVVTMMVINLSGQDPPWLSYAFRPLITRYTAHNHCCLQPRVFTV